MKQPTDAQRALRTGRTLPFSPADIFAAFADPGRLAAWWGPRGFTNTFERFEFREGGHWQFVMHAPDGAHYRNESVFLELAAGTRVVIQHVSQPQFTLTVTLSKVEGGTDVQWVQLFDDPQVAAAIRPIAEPANEQNLDRLHQHLRGELP